MSRSPCLKAESGRPSRGALLGSAALAAGLAAAVTACGASGERSAGSPRNPDRAVPWRHVETRDGGRTLVLELRAGGPPCDGVKSVDVRESAGRVTVTVTVGEEPGADCGPGHPAILGTFRVQARLREPVGARRLVDGARP